MTKIEQLRLNGWLPSPKGVALAIMEISRREDASLAQIAKIVQSDPVTAGRLLHMANSAAYAGRPVASVMEAIQRLGLAAVRQLALGFSLVDQYRHGACRGFDYTHFWSHSLLMAVAMQELGSLTRVAPADELFACGLMARIGYLALATVHPVEYAEVIAGTDGSLTEREQRLLQVDHNEFTVAILTDCGIPNALVEPVFYHESPDASGFKDGSRPHQLVHLFYHAKRLADLSLADETKRNGNIAELLLLGGKLGLNADDAGALVDQIVARWRLWSDQLQLPAQTFPAFSRMVTNPSVPAAQGDSEATMRILVVDGNDAAGALLHEPMLGVLGRQVQSVASGEEALARALEMMPHVVMLDSRLSGMGGLALCRAMRASEWGKSIYVVMIVTDASEQLMTDAFDAGIDDFLVTPIDMNTLRARIRAAYHYVSLLEGWESDRAQLRQFSAELAVSNRKLERFALTDLLTGLQNRRAGMDTLGQAWGATTRTGEPLSALMIDLDDFKTVNDTHGHATGDKVLIDVATAIRTSARREDSVCRFGGEEFLVVCRNTNLEGAIRAAERLQEKIRTLSIRHQNIDIRTAISIGVASREAGMGDAETLVNAADKALYASKHAGRDRISVCIGGQTRQHAH